MLHGTLTDIWPVLLSGLFALTWLIRLEAKVIYLENQKLEVKEKLDSMQEKLIEIGESLARLEGKLEHQTLYD